MNDTEQLIKEALGKLAERTPHPGPTLNALRRKRKRQRNNIFLIATAGVAAVAVLIFTGLVASSRYQPLDGDNAAAALMPDKAGAQTVALKYAPHWLPNGFVETHRVVGEQVQRDYSPKGSVGNPLEKPAQPRVTVRTIGKLPDDRSMFQEVGVRGLQAWVQTFQDPGRGAVAELFWKAQDVLNVTVSGLDNARQVALQVADSVRADSKLTYLPAFRLDDKPANEIWGTSGYDWTARWAGEKYGVTVSTSQPQKTDGEPVTVRGKQGAVVEQGTVVVRDSSGFWITATAEKADTAVDVANRVQLQIQPSPDTVWLGQGL
ncbi:hypothetical protein LFM09_04585 [Lentzea alba]|uniref:hypothetical protein n=1 Tax=Lentzea alba TaxID=2714351 RepID=UPI0039BFF4E2